MELEEQVQIFQDNFLQAFKLIRYEKKRVKKRAAKRNMQFDFHYNLWYTKLFSPGRMLKDSHFTLNYRITKKHFCELINYFRQEGTFVRGVDCVGKKGIHLEVKILACLKMLALGEPCSEVAEHYGMSTATASVYFDRFIALVPQFLENYVKKPGRRQIRRILHQHERDFQISGLLGFLDCTHFLWHKCPHALKGMYTGRNMQPTLTLEALADSRNRIIYFNFPIPGALNDLSIIHNSQITRDYLKGDMGTPYNLNGERRIIP